MWNRSSRLLPALSVTLACLASCGGKEPAASSGSEVLPQVLLLGDSISMGYTPTVQEALAEVALVQRATKDNGRQENCEGTTKGAAQIERWLAQAENTPGGRWDIVHVNFGLHDLKHVDPETGKNSNNVEDPCQADLETYELQLGLILDAIEASGAEIIVATTTPVPTGGVRPYRDPESVARYNEVLTRLAEVRECQVNDLFAFASEGPGAWTKPKDVHFTKEGSVGLGIEVARVLREKLKARK